MNLFFNFSVPSSGGEKSVPSTPEKRGLRSQSMTKSTRSPATNSSQSPCRGAPASSDSPAPLNRTVSGMLATALDILEDASPHQGASRSTAAGTSKQTLGNKPQTKHATDFYAAISTSIRGGKQTQVENGDLEQFWGSDSDIQEPIADAVTSSTDDQPSQDLGQFLPYGVPPAPGPSDIITYINTEALLADSESPEHGKKKIKAWPSVALPEGGRKYKLVEPGDDVLRNLSGRSKVYYNVGKTALKVSKNEQIIFVRTASNTFRMKRTSADVAGE